ncbi:MAG: DegV family protein [Oscillospiraceae bacterium]
MNADYIIYTDDTSDLPANFYKENQIGLVYLNYTLEGVEYSGTKTLSPKDFYDKMRSGATPQTSQMTPEQATFAFEKALREGKDILHLGFSSGLSGSFNSARIAMDSLREKYPERKMFCVDTLCASLGEGLLLFKAIQLKKAGKSIDDVYSWLEENKLHLCHLFTVDDLMYLHRGGRVSKATAVAGSILGIKPILHVDDEGHLTPIGKIRGRKQSITALADEMGKRIGDWGNATIAISHCDCEDEAIQLRDIVMKRFPIKECIINYVGTVIGAHAGPKTLALFFMGNSR